MHARLNLSASPTAAEFGKHLVAASRTLPYSTLPVSTQNLVMLRASQSNDFAWCTEMHTKDAAHAGKTSLRLNLVATWREATVFTDAERAALNLAEQATRIADAAGGVSDDAWANAAERCDEEQLAALVCTNALINAFNRGNVLVQQPAGEYRPGRLGSHRP